MIVRLIMALLAGLAVAAMTGCGNRSDLIPSTSASSLQSQLSKVRVALDDGNCEAATAAASRFRDRARRLPTSIDAELRGQIRKGAQNLVAEVPSDCESATPTETTDTTTTETTPTTTETTPTTTDTTPTIPTETAPPVDTTTTPVTPTPGDGTGGAGSPLVTP